ncbi:hypothetical protein D3C71_1366140 [compost metagenome]
MAVRAQECGDGGQHQGQRDEGQIPRHQVERRCRVHPRAFGAASALDGQCALRAGFGALGALGLEGFDVLVLGVAAIVVGFVDLAAVAHPAVGRLGLGFVVFVGFDNFRERQLAGFLQRLCGQRARVHALHADHT